MSFAAAAGLLSWLAGRRELDSRAVRGGQVVAGTLLFRGLTGFCPITGAVRSRGLAVDTKRALGGRGGVHVREAITINRPVAEVYATWRRLENLPRFMAHLLEVRQIDDRRSHWVARGPGNTRIEWDAEIINEVPDKVIGWKSLDGAEVVHAGSVQFHQAPGGRGTELRVTMQYDPPAGKVGARIAQLFLQDPASQIREDLRRLKQWLEAGAPPTTAGQPSARVQPGRHAR